MFRFSWKKLFGIQSSRPTPRRKQRPLAVECLEDRVTPAPLHVGSGPNEYATIQAAVNAAKAGDQIQIDKGTYQGPVTINKPLTLQGQGNQTIIQAPAAGFAPPGPGNPDAIVEVTATSAQLQNLIIEGAPGGTPNLLYGVRVDGYGSLSLKNSTVTNIIDSSNPSLGVAIDVGSTSASPDGAGAQVGLADIENSTISNYQRAGIVVTNTGSYAEVKNNTITASSTFHSDSQTGVEISEGATADVENNTISGNTNASDGTGILIFSPGVQRLPDYDSDPNDFAIASIKNNKISGNDYGVFGGQTVAMLADQPASADIENNQIWGNTYVGIEFDNSSNLSITNNHLSNNGSNNTADGGIYLFQSTNSVLSNNQSTNNNGSGIYLDAGSIGNTLNNNHTTGNVDSLATGNADAVDLSIGSGTAGTANTWTNDNGQSYFTLSGNSLFQQHPKH